MGSSGKALLLKEDQLNFEVMEDPASLKEALWRIESIDDGQYTVVGKSSGKALLLPLRGGSYIRR